MERLENTLPLDLQLDSALSRHKDYLEEQLEYAQCLVPGDMVRFDRELERDFVRTYRFCETVVAESAAYDKPQEATSNFYRGMLFGMQVCEEVETQPTNIVLLEDYLCQNFDGPVLDTILDDTQHYINERSNVDDLLCKYGDFDTPREGAAHSELFQAGAGLVMMLAEREIAEQHIRRCVRESSIDNFI